MDHWSSFRAVYFRIRDSRGKLQLPKRRIKQGSVAPHSCNHADQLDELTKQDRPPAPCR